MRLIHEVAPATPIALCRAWHREVEGRPWLLAELAHGLAAREAAIDARRESADPLVTPTAHTAVRRRLAELTARQRGVAAALAVIGEAPPPHVLAGVAGAPVAELGTARDTLRAAGLLASGAERPAHELIATAILDDLALTERERLHRAAARELIAARASNEVIARHLVHCRPQGEPEVTALLLCAAADAARDGEPAGAEAYLTRALDERAPSDDRVHILLRLAGARFDAGVEGSSRALRDALAEADAGAAGATARVAALTHLAGLAALGGDREDVANLIELELRDVGGAHERVVLQAAALDALMAVPGRDAQRAALAQTIDPANAGADAGAVQDAVLAHRAWLDVERARTADLPIARVRADRAPGPVTDQRASSGSGSGSGGGSGSGSGP